MYLLKINTAARALLAGNTPIKKYVRRGVSHTVEVQPFDALPLTSVELLTLDVCISLYNTGYHEFDVFDVLGACCGGVRAKPSKVSIKQVNEVNTAIMHLRDISIYIDNSTAPLIDVVANGCKIYGLRGNDNSAVPRWHFVNGIPLLLENAEQLRGVVAYPVELMDLGDTCGLNSAYIKKYLLDRIFTSNAQKGTARQRRTGANVVRFSTIKKISGCTTRRATQQVRNRVRKMLDAFTKCDNIPLLHYYTIDAGTARERYVLLFGYRTTYPRLIDKRADLLRLVDKKII